MLLLLAAPVLAGSVKPEALRAAMGLKLGSWVSQMTITDITVEPVPDGDPAELEKAKAALLSKIGETNEFRECLWDSPHLMYIPGLKVESGCEFSRVEAENGRFGLAGICARPQIGVRVEMAMEGSYSPEAMTSSHDIVTTTGDHRIRLRAKSSSRYAGPCE